MSAPGACADRCARCTTRWQSRFGGRTDVVGRAISINGRPFTVIGVAPRGFHGTEVFYRPEIWVPMSMQPQIELGSAWLETRATQNVMVIARLRSGVSREQAGAAIGAAVSQLSKEHPRNGALQLALTRPGLFGDIARRAGARVCRGDCSGSARC